MLKPGLVSVSFRKLSVEQLIELARENGLVGIEWGGDVHVPHGDVDAARSARAATESAGLVVTSYGSYYRVGETDSVDFDSVLTSARELGAPIIRVWAGHRGSGEADTAQWDRVVADARRIGDVAATAGIEIGFEFHDGTLTDTLDTSVKLMERVDHENVGIYWQPKPRLSRQENLDALRRLKPHLKHLHVFHWLAGNVRRPLEEGREDWSAYLQAASDATSRWALMEFVQDDEPANLATDAAVLQQLLRNLN